MKILIFGGTGAMGIHLVNFLVNRGDEVYITSRKDLISKGNLNYIKGDAHDLDFAKGLLKGHFDVLIDFMVYSLEAFESRVELLLSSTKQYFFLSSARVFANSDVPITEESERLDDVSLDQVFLDTDDYSLTKARQEDIIKNSKYSNWTILRPYITYSENRFQLGVLEKEEWLYRATKGRTIVFSVDINEKQTTLTYGYDVSNCIKELIGKESALGEAFNITSSSSNKWEDILNIYLDILEKHLGFRPKVILQSTEGFLKWKNSEYQVKYDRLFNREFNNAKISNYFQKSNFLDLKEGLEITLKSFLKLNEFKNINWLQEALKDRISGDFTNLLEIPNNKERLIYILYRFFNIKKIKKWRNFIQMK